MNGSSILERVAYSFLSPHRITPAGDTAKETDKDGNVWTIDKEGQRWLSPEDQPPKPAYTPTGEPARPRLNEDSSKEAWLQEHRGLLGYYGKQTPDVNYRDIVHYASQLPSKYIETFEALGKVLTDTFIGGEEGAKDQAAKTPKGSTNKGGEKPPPKKPGGDTETGGGVGKATDEFMAFLMKKLTAGNDYDAGSIKSAYDALNDNSERYAHQALGMHILSHGRIQSPDLMIASSKAATMRDRIGREYSILSDEGASKDSREAAKNSLSSLMNSMNFANEQTTAINALATVRNADAQTDIAKLGYDYNVGAAGSPEWRRFSDALRVTGGDPEAAFAIMNAFKAFSKLQTLPSTSEVTEENLF